MTPPPPSIPPSPLSRRERQIMDVIYAGGEASATEVLKKLPDPPSYSAIRALLRILEEKGHLQHRSAGGKYIFRPTRARGKEGRTAMQRVLKTFFDNSAAKAVATLMSLSDAKLTDAELSEIAKIVERARSKEKKS